MCLAYPGTVIAIEKNTATISYNHCTCPPLVEGEQNGHSHAGGNPSGQIKTVLLGDSRVKIGDKVLVQMGIVIKVLSNQEYESIVSAWTRLE